MIWCLVSIVFSVVCCSESIPLQKCTLPRVATFFCLSLGFHTTLMTLGYTSQKDPASALGQPSTFLVSVKYSIFILVKTNTFSTDFKQILVSTDLHQYIDFPTHLLGHILDLLISSHGPDVIRHVRGCDWLSDHC